MKKKVLIIVVTSVLVISLFVMALIAYVICSFTYANKIKITDICSFYNQENQYSISFQMIGNPMFFDSTSVKISLLDNNGNVVESLNTSIHDDGALVGEGNISVKWFNEYVEVTLSGSEQSDRIYIMEY